VLAGKTLQVKLDAINRRDDELVSNASRPPPPFRPHDAVNLLKLLPASAAHVNSTIAQRDQQRIREEKLREAFKDLWLRATCDELYHALPRELRDMIYGDLIEDSFLGEVPADGSTDAEGATSILYHEQHGANYHCHNQDMMGPHVFRDLVQQFYSKITIDAQCFIYGRLRTYLTRDHLEIGFRPLDHLSHLHMEIPEADFENANIHRDLESLALLKEGARIHV
jgi:hypothetical protein